MEWSHYQQDIFAAVRDSRDSLIIEAVAGSGKTSTIIECTNHVAGSERIAFLAFNKSIASELGRRITAGNARCMTLHAAGFAAWKQGLGWDANDCRVDGKKTWGIVEDTLSWPDRKKFGAGIVRLVALAKGIGIVPRVAMKLASGKELEQYIGLVEDDVSVWQSLMDHHGIDEEDTDIELARKVLGESIARAREVIDFDDMLYMPVVAGAAFEKYDVVFLDEAQDVNAMQVEMVAQMVDGQLRHECGNDGNWIDNHTQEGLLPRGRLIAVGDPNQAIYGFRGAGTDAMTELGRRFGCRSLPLSVSYRCPRGVVRWAQQWVPRIEWAEDAPEGIVELDGGGELKCFQPSDAILCRVTRPLVVLAFRLIRAKVACRVIGRDIGAGMTGLVKKLGRTWLVPGATQDGFRGAFQVKLDGYRAREAGRLAKRREPALLAGLHDRLDTLQVFVDELAEGDGIEELISSITALFRDAEADRRIDGAWIVNLSTVHKAKGMEFDRVFILDAREYMPSPWARAGWERQQERNIQYVAATRARRELRYVESEGL